MNRSSEPRGHRQKTLSARYPECQGLSLTEMMISILLFMPLVLHAIEMVRSASCEQLLAEQQLLMEQDAQLALSMISKAVQIATHEAKGPATAATATHKVPRIRGLDNATLAARADISAGPSGPGLSGSDVLVVRLPDSTTPASAVLNCAGISIASLASGKPVHNYSVFYLGRSASGEPELRCKYLTANGWNSEPLIAGVENFQVLYGLDRNGDGLFDQFVPAKVIDAESTGSASSTSLWDRVVALKIALLIRSARRVQQSSMPATWDMLGEAYSAQYAAQDRGARLSTADFPVESRYRLRRVHEQVIFLRNPEPASAQP